MSPDIKGIRMTSQRTRDRIAKTLIEMGIQSGHVLDAFSWVRIGRFLSGDSFLSSFPPLCVPFVVFVVCITAL